MWDSILNYSVYTVSCHGNGQSITDGGQSASTQQVKEVSKVKQSSKGHTGGGWALLPRLFVPWTGYKLLNHFSQPRQQTSYELPLSAIDISGEINEAQNSPI